AVLLWSVSTAQFGSTVSYPAGTQPVWVTSGDLNRDGNPDLVVADNAGGGVTALLGTSTGTFGAGAFAPTGSHPTFVTLADVDRDGKLDAFVTNRGSNTLRIL